MGKEGTLNSVGALKTAMHSERETVEQMPPTPTPGNGSGLSGWFRVPAFFLPMGWGSMVFQKAPLPSAFLEFGYLMDLISCSIVELLLVSYRTSFCRFSQIF